MAILIEKDEKGRKLYQGFLSSEETKQADLLLGYLQEEIPQIEKEIQDKYGDGAISKYYIGKRLGELLTEYDVQEKERGYFWNEIKNFATENVRKRDEGGTSITRKYYEQCYQLSQIDLSIVEKFSWMKWSELLDRKGNREDKRLFTWIGHLDQKITDPVWRSFEKGLNSFLKNKDTSVFEDDELFAIYDMILVMAIQWHTSFAQFVKQYPKSAKIKTKSNWEKKYIELCFKCRKANKKNLDTNECSVLFDSLMKPTSRS